MPTYCRITTRGHHSYHVVILSGCNQGYTLCGRETKDATILPWAPGLKVLCGVCRDTMRTHPHLAEASEEATP